MYNEWRDKFSHTMLPRLYAGDRPEGLIALKSFVIIRGGGIVNVFHVHLFDRWKVYRKYLFRGENSY